MNQLLIISLFVSCTVFGYGLPYNPLNALNWDNIDLFDQIQDKFIGKSSYRNPVGFEVRRLDASNNNPQGLGATNSQTQRCIPPVYSDGFNSLTGTTRMNAREISNVIAKQIPEDDMKFVNNRHLTQFAWQWGQFIDHDITLISEARDTLDHSLDDGDISIYVPCNDPQYDQGAECDADIEIEFFRTLQFPGTGTGIDNPRQQRNEITSFVDGSMIYGSDEDRGDALRAFVDGKLGVTEDNFLLYNDIGIHNEPNDDPRFFIAGDVRPQEQLGLLTMHTIWVRFHNVIAEYVAESVISSGYCSRNDKVFDEIVYQYTKIIVTAIVQKITYQDWLPTLFGDTAVSRFLGEYDGYDSSINPAACLIFSSAAYRLGHTLLPNFLPLRNEDCSFWTDFDENLCPVCDLELGGIHLRDTFFVPEIAADNDGFFEALLNGFSCTLANEIDVHITEGVRNFLFESALNEQGERIFGNLDLIAINLQRGREHGLPDFNSVRKNLSPDKYGNKLQPHLDFDSLSSNHEITENFEHIYGDINDIDLFLGLLAEDHFEDGSFGETISAVVLQQFGRLRDGDRFWYQNYIKPGELLDFINCITLKTVIELTTDIKNIDSLDPIQHNIFQNQRAIPIFAGVNTFKAKTDIINPAQNDNDNNNNFNNIVGGGNGINKNVGGGDETIVIQLTNMQIFLLFVTIISIIGCSCFTIHQFKKNKMNSYRPVKYDTETDTEVSDREKLQS